MKLIFFRSRIITPFASSGRQAVHSNIAPPQNSSIEFSNDFKNLSDNIWHHPEDEEQHNRSNMKSKAANRPTATTLGRIKHHKEQPPTELSINKHKNMYHTFQNYTNCKVIIRINKSNVIHNHYLCTFTHLVKYIVNPNG